MNIAHRTHVLPRTYLKRFKSSPGKIWRFDERRSDWREVSLKKQAGVVPDFYPDHVEKWLATNIEQPAADGLQKLASAEPPQVEIAKEARLSLSYYLAVQLYRTPAALEERWGPAVSATIDKHKEKRGQNELIDRLEALLHQLDPDSEKAGFAIPLALDGKVFKQAVDRVARDVFTFTWRVGVAPESVLLVAADAPVVPRTLEDGRRFLLFALSSRKIPVCVSTDTFDSASISQPIDVIEIPAGDARKYNSELVQGARRYIFSSKPEAWVRKVRAKRTT
ncbi:MAG: DUF4238 domain-containing protein [Acidobacteriota bacterium]|nr:DUF4238 domain-containing protein [Acidobacteriota bacterium]